MNKSPREQVQDRLVEFLEEHSNVFTAPYGVLPGLQKVKNGPGKVRTVTFGLARFLDATAYIWSPVKISVDAAGPAMHRIAGNYATVDELIKTLNEEFCV